MNSNGDSCTVHNGYYQSFDDNFATKIKHIREYYDDGHLTTLERMHSRITPNVNDPIYNGKNDEHTNFCKVVGGPVKNKTENYFGLF